MHREKIVGDMMFFQGKYFLRLVNYFSKSIALKESPNQASESHIIALKSNFISYGIPKILYTDDRQYKSYKFKKKSCCIVFQTHCAQSILC